MHEKQKDDGAPVLDPDLDFLSGHENDDEVAEAQPEANEPLDFAFLKQRMAELSYAPTPEEPPADVVRVAPADEDDAVSDDQSPEPASESEPAAFSLPEEEEFSEEENLSLPSVQEEWSADAAHGAHDSQTQIEDEDEDTLSHDVAREIDGLFDEAQATEEDAEGPDESEPLAGDFKSGDDDDSSDQPAMHLTDSEPIPTSDDPPQDDNEESAGAEEDEPSLFLESGPGLKLEADSDSEDTEPEELAIAESDDEAAEKGQVKDDEPLILSATARRPGSSEVEDAEESEAMPAPERALFQHDKRNSLTDQISLTSLFENTRYLGLDIGENSVKYALLKRGPMGMTLLNCGFYPYASEEEHDAEPESESDDEAESPLVKILQNRLPHKLLKNTQVTTIVSGLELVYKNVQIPEMSKKEMQRAVPWSCRKDLPFPIEETRFDYRIIGKSEENQKLDVFVIAAKNELINRHLQLLNKAHMMPMKIATAASALANLFQTALGKEAEACHVVVDVGRSASQIIVVNEGNLLFAREISVGGDDLTETLTNPVFVDGEEIQLSRKRAEELKRVHGLSTSLDNEAVTTEGIPLKQLSALMRPIFEKLTKELKRTIDFCREQHQIEDVESVHLTGGGACLRNLPELLADELDTHVEILNPIDFLQVKKMELESRLVDLGPHLAMSVGLALDRKRELNLLPEKLRTSLLVLIFRRVYRYVFVILLLIMILLSQNIARKLQEIKTRFLTVKAEFEQAEPRRERFSELQLRLQNLKLVQKQYEGAMKVNLAPIDHLKVLSNLLPSNMALTSVNILRMPSGQKKKPEPIEHLVFSGVAFTNNSMEGMNLAHFLLLLKNSGHFKQITLKSQKITADGHLEFNIECEI